MQTYSLGIIPLVAWLALGAAFAPAAPPTTRLRSTSNDFSIPFAIEDESIDFVQLVVSSDQGQSWHVADSVIPKVGRFQFRAPFEGEFWFYLRTVDRRGHVSPQPPEAELRVLVESAKNVQSVSAALPIGAVSPGGLADLQRVVNDPSRLRMVKARSFDIDYLPPTVGEPIQSVSLHWTRDGGQTWNRYGIDEDRLSPMRVNVEQEGLYGFTLVFELARGEKLPSVPVAGDAPAAWVGVDMQNPEARLLTVEAVGESELIVRWEASDARLAALPVSLAYRQPDEPQWTTFAERLPNNGVYQGRLSTRVPAQLFFKLEVRDEAGNVQVVTTPEPVTTVLRTVMFRGSSGGSDKSPSARWYQVIR